MFAFYLLLVPVWAISGEIISNNRPIIGILSEELTDKMTANYGPHQSYIASSYVQFVHGAGGRAAPILIGQNDSYYEKVLSYVNGVLLPGGSVWFDSKNGGYVEAGRRIMKAADKMNEKGDYFPVWGTCLGFELMTFLANNEHELRINCSAYNESNPIIPTKEAKASRIFGGISVDMWNLLVTKNVTSNFHHFCISPEDFDKYLGANWLSLSTNTDDNGVAYVSTMEHKSRPYFGTQWHPEKPLYEWGHYNIPHDEDTVQVSQQMARFLVNQARKNQHRFPNEETERKYLIYNFPATFGHATSTYTQLYFFD